ncbi:hypothetical protein D3C72_1277440 [compost metagenome]
MFQWQPGGAQLRGAGQHCVHDPFGRGAAHLHARGAGLGFDAFEGVRHQAGSQRGRCRQQQRLGLTARNFFGAATNLLQAGQRAFHVVIQQKALFGGRDARPAAVEQGIADFRFKLLQQAADGRLRTPKQAPGSGDATCRHDGREGLELAKFHLGCFMLSANSDPASMRAANS